MALLLYVNDILLAGNNLDTIKDVKTSLSNQFKLKDLGLAKFILGMKITRFKNGISLSQKKYILELISNWDLLVAKLVLFLMDTHTSCLKKKENWLLIYLLIED